SVFLSDRWGGQRRAEWMRREAEGPQRLFYRAELFRNPIGTFSLGNDPGVEVEASPFLDDAERLAAETLLQQAREQSIDNISLAQRLVERLIVPREQMDQNTALLLGRSDTEEVRVRVMKDLLSMEQIPARAVRGILLSEGRRFQPLRENIEIWQNGSWHFLDVTSAQIGAPANFLFWQRGGNSLLDVEGGTQSRVRFSVLRDIRPATMVAHERAQLMNRPLLEFSIYSLPLEDQNIFKRLLLIPLGALVMVLIRNVVGLTTSGTFMPVLIALSFQETDLLPGLVLFILIVSAGLTIRSLLSHLNLLVVPRISAVVIVVVMLMAALSIVSNKLDLSAGMRITFFPMIIIAWTIERLSILWEEEGSKAAIKRGFMSLFVAILAFLVMDIPLLQHLVFAFPELLLLVLAAILLLGQYSGYRLSELTRFSVFKP
ncbi:MAG: inactive transglutaminase family protein, partial [Verrucomicrobia bacterium]|nr:inactive transglutaminase family protein [Verrucomicrobiota bacterium]